MGILFLFLEKNVWKMFRKYFLLPKYAGTEGWIWAENGIDVSYKLGKMLWVFVCVCVCVCVCVSVCAQLCLTLWDPLDCSPPGSSVHGISQAWILEWVHIFYSRGSSQPRDGTHVFCVSCVGRQILYHCDNGKINRIQKLGGPPLFSLFYNPLQYSCLENPMNREAWRAVVHGVAKSQTGLSN